MVVIIVVKVVHIRYVTVKVVHIRYAAIPFSLLSNTTNFLNFYSTIKTYNAHRV